jgi:hypothetical protein
LLSAAVNAVDIVARVQGFLPEISYSDGAFVKKEALGLQPRPFKKNLWKFAGIESPPINALYLVQLTQLLSVKRQRDFCP